MLLSKRLKSIGDMITPGYRIADIGTDHAFLPIEMVMSGIIPGALAMDINPGPLETAETHINTFGLSDKIECRLSDGMKALLQDEVRCAVIAGMGGDLIARIIRDDPDKVYELVLSPHTHPESVRKALRECNYHIIDENMIMDADKYYPVIKAIKSDTLFERSDDADDYFGPVLINKRHSCLISFLLKEKEKFADIPQKAGYRELVDNTLRKMRCI